MNREDIKQKVIEYIQKNNHVSYAELEHLFEDIGHDYKGDKVIMSADCEHVIFWDGWNVETIELMNEVQRSGKVHKEPADPLIYLIDGRGLNLPLVKTCRQYKTDHWLPVVFCRGEAPV